MAWNADDYGLTPDDWRALFWSEDCYRREQRWDALKALWGKPIVDKWSTSNRTDGVTDYVRNRQEEWTLWSAVKATIGIVLDRCWGQVQENKYGRSFGIDLAFWDSRPVYGGYTVVCLTLHPRCRVSICNDGETFL